MYFAFDSFWRKLCQFSYQSILSSSLASSNRHEKSTATHNKQAAKIILVAAFRLWRAWMGLCEMSYASFKKKEFKKIHNIYFKEKTKFYFPMAFKLHPFENAILIRHLKRWSDPITSRSPHTFASRFEQFCDEDISCSPLYHCRYGWTFD